MNTWGSKFWMALGAIGVVILMVYDTKAFEYDKLDQLYSQTVEPSVQIDDNCSGTIINESTNPDGTVNFQILTAQHCMRKKPVIGEEHTVDIPVYVDEKPMGEAKFKAKLIKTSGDVGDLALLEVTNAAVSFDIKAAKVGGPDILPRMKFGADVFGVHFPGAYSQTITAGILGHREASFNMAVMFQRVAMSTIGGSSGSGLFMEVNGEYYLVGTLTGGFSETFNFYMPLEDIIKFLTPGPTFIVDPVFGE